jgi:3-deoxy-D-manno-octulosonate 8-phosphate phosphatase (KDO 8-P phosphatase)
LPRASRHRQNRRVDAKLKKIKMLIMDVDGVLTDCRVFLDSDGQWKRLFSIRDGYGIARLIEAGYKTAVITGSKSMDIEKRVKGLGIHYFFQGSTDKLPAFMELQKDTGLRPEEMAYIGDDLFDIPLLEKVGFAASVPEAMEDVIAMVDYVTKRPGGNGAVREICDFIFKFGAFSNKDGQP